ncbi:hypothetical protein [Rubrivivax gelatinosus]|uniref:hypothetical protein n=1 Tax=Rubrivivax gelatinosus TaxID=28068 RepID=UPI00030508DB|nr:hypothetical protein [Rubrivivax gelatinosus]MBG6083217.1 hypothetical protein [Rubrivivax gelatinosus]
MIAERLYQAIIDKVIEEQLDFDQAAAMCGFDPDTLLECFDAKPNAKPRPVYEFLGREQIEKTADFLRCPRLSIFFLADVFNPNDVKALASNLGETAGQDRKVMVGNLARYLEDIARSQLFGRPDAILDEFTSASLANNLVEACERACIPFKKVAHWLHGEPATLADLQVLRTIAETIGIGIAPVLIATGVAQPNDLVWEGLPVDPMIELQKALDVDIW